MTEIPDWLRRKMFGTLTPEEYGKVLEKKIAAGEMTPEEAFRLTGEGKIMDGKTVAALSYYCALKNRT